LRLAKNKLEELLWVSLGVLFQKLQKISEVYAQEKKEKEVQESPFALKVQNSIE